MNIVEKIRKLHEDQHRRNAPPVSASDIPLSFEAMSPQWLSKVLCKDVPGAQVMSRQLGPVDNGSSNRRKLQVTYNDAGQQAGLPSKLFCKASHDIANRVTLGVSGSLLGETTFYNEVRPILDIEAPVSVFANYDDESFNSILMLKDISDDVESFCSHETPMSKQRVESQMDVLATMHSRFLQSPELGTILSVLPSFAGYLRKSMTFGFESGANQGFLDAESVIPPALFKRFPEIWKKTVESTELQDQLPQTFVHNDVHVKNWYIMPGDRMGLSDWQCCTRGHWSRDLAYAISTACTVEDRRVWERDLIRYYLDKMEQAGAPKVSFDDAFTYYRQQMFSVLGFWTITLAPPPDLPDMQPKDITLEFVRRITVAMDDIDSIDSL